MNAPHLVIIFARWRLAGHLGAQCGTGAHDPKRLPSRRRCRNFAIPSEFRGRKYPLRRAPRKAVVDQIGRTKMAYAIIHFFPGGTKEQYEASIAAV
jgi:hypothetical protein